MPGTRYTLRSPSLEIHEQAMDLLPGHGRLLVDNRKRLSLSAEIEDEAIIDQLESMGVQVAPDIQYDPDQGSGD